MEGGGSSGGGVGGGGGGLGGGSGSSGSSGMGEGHSSRLDGGGSDTDEDYPHNVQQADSSLQESFTSASNTVKPLEH